MRLVVEIPEPFAERVLRAFAHHEMMDPRPATVQEVEAAIKEYLWRRLYDYEKWLEIENKEKWLRGEKEKW